MPHIYPASPALFESVFFVTSSVGVIDKGPDKGSISKASSTLTNLVPGELTARTDETKMCIDREGQEKLLSGSRDNLLRPCISHLDFYQFIRSMNSPTRGTFMAECDWITVGANSARLVLLKNIKFLSKWTRRSILLLKTGSLCISASWRLTLMHRKDTVLTAHHHIHVQLITGSGIVQTEHNAI